MSLIAQLESDLFGICITNCSASLNCVTTLTNMSVRLSQIYYKAAIIQRNFGTKGWYVILPHISKKNNEILTKMKEVLLCLLKEEIFRITTNQRENVVQSKIHSCCAPYLQ